MSDLDRSLAFTALLDAGHLEGLPAGEGGHLVTRFLGDYWVARAGGLMKQTMHEFAQTWEVPHAAHGGRADRQ